MALFYLPDTELGTGFAGLSVQADKYDDLFAAAGQAQVISTETAEPPVEAPAIEELPQGALHPAAVHMITGCINASDIIGIAAGDVLQVNVPTIIANESPCITMDVLGVSLNCSGNTLQGNGSYRGVDVTANQVEIINCNFFNYSSGSRFIYINGGRNVNITNCNFTNSSMNPGGRGISTAAAPASSDIRIRDSIFDNIATERVLDIISATAVHVYRNNFLRNTGVLAGSPSSLYVQTGTTINFTNNYMNISTEWTGVTTGYFNNNNFSDLDLYFTAPVTGLTITNGITVQMLNNNPVPIAVLMSSPTTCLVQNNTFQNNGRITMSGVSTANRFLNNNFDPVSKDATSTAGVYLIGPSRFDGNYLANGEMSSVKVTGNNSNITNNRIINVVGDAFIVEGNNNTFRNNTVYNFTGDAFLINGTHNRFLLNNITYFITLSNTSFNPNISAPQVPVQNAAFLLISIANSTNISHNAVTGMNPLNLLNGLWGVRTNGVTDNTTIYNNTFTNLRTGVWMKNCFRPAIMQNTFINNEQRAIVVQNCTTTIVTTNNISAPGLTATTNPYEMSAGIYVYRHDGGYFADNNISQYNIGIYLNNASDNLFERHNIQGTGTEGIGIFSVYGARNNFSQFSISNKSIGVKLVYTNFSNFTGVNTTASVTYGYQLYQSNNNSVQNSLFTAGQEVSIEFSHFSSNNTANGNTFGGAIDIDCLFDLFAATNTGAGNGGPTQRQENGAAGNNIL